MLCHVMHSSGGTVFGPSTSMKSALMRRLMATLLSPLLPDIIYFDRAGLALEMMRVDHYCIDFGSV